MTTKTNEEMAEILLSTIQDKVSDLLYYDRKEDEDLPVGAIEKLIATNEISVSDLVEEFESHLRISLT